MALALYRKYRPATFAELVGQEHVTEPLRTALTAGRINHAYLFSGPRGCGKTSSARILARSLNCVAGPTPNPCGKCPSCQGLAPGGAGTVDVVELDAASHGGVDDARELRDRAFYAPAESRYRVFIIDEAHMVTTQGFNALLKIVEEPPEHLIFVFATTEPDKVLPTIRSRTHHYPFRLIPPNTLRTLLEKICTEEGVHVDPAVWPLVLKAGGGSARDTLSVLDQLFAGAGPDGISYQRAAALLGVTDVTLIDDMVDGLAAGDGSAVFATINKVVDAGHDPRRFTTDLLDRLRDLVLLSAVPDAAQRGLITAPESQTAAMMRQVEHLGPATLYRFAEIAHTGLTEMRGATAPRLLLELVCARMMLPATDQSEAALLQRVEQLEQRAQAAQVNSATAPIAEPAPAIERPAPQLSVPPVPAPQTPAPTLASVETDVPSASSERQPEPAPAPVAAPTALDGAGVRRVWPEVLAAVRASSRSTEAMLSNATVQSVNGNAVTLVHNSMPLAKRLSELRNAEAIAAALNTVLGGQWQVSCVHGEVTGGPGAMAAPVKPQPPVQPIVPEPAPQQTVEQPATPPAAPVTPVSAEIPPDEEPDYDTVDEAADSTAAAAEETPPTQSAHDHAISLLTTELGARILAEN